MNNLKLYEMMNIKIRNVETSVVVQYLGLGRGKVLPSHSWAASLV